MSVELKVPEVGESITEVEIGEWLKTVGEPVHQEETLVMIETDKVTVELPAPSSGKLIEILKKEGDTAAVGDVIGRMEAGEVAVAAPAPAAAPSAAPAADGAASGGGHVMPAAARAMHSTGVARPDVAGSGPGGRVLKEDVMRAAAAGPAKSTGVAARAPAARTEEVVPMTSLRRRVAERLVTAQQNAALLTTFNEVDMGEVMALRREYKEQFIGKHDVKLGFMSFFVKAAVEALKEIPSVNAEIRGDDIVYKNFYDVGVAVGGGKGLVVPVIRSAEALSFAEIEKTIIDFAVRAKSGKLKLDELQGGTFTISNGGVYGSMLSTPIVNPPQSGILGLHNIQDRPMAVDGQVVVRPVMYLALTYDHRIIDGREAVTFLKRIKELIENPARILLEV